MWVTKLLISPVKKKIFCPKTTKFGPKLAFFVNLGQAMQAYSMPCCGSVGACGAYLLYIIILIVAIHSFISKEIGKFELQVFSLSSFVSDKN